QVSRFSLVLSEFGQGVQISTAPVFLLRRKGPLQPSEIGKDLLGRRLVRVLRQGSKPASQIRLDHLAFRPEMTIKGLFAYAEFGDDRVDADRANSLPVEQAVDGLQDLGAGNFFILL